MIKVMFSFLGNKIHNILFSLFCGNTNEYQEYIDLLKINNDRQNVTHKTIENLRSKL